MPIGTSSRGTRKISSSLSQVTFYSLVSRKDIRNLNRLMGPRHIGFRLALDPSDILSNSEQYCLCLFLLVFLNVIIGKRPFIRFPFLRLRSFRQEFYASSFNI